MKKGPSSTENIRIAVLPEKPVATFDWAELDGIRTTSLARTEPERGFTRAMYAKRYGLDQSRAETEIRRLLREGVLQRVGTLSLLRENGKGGTNAAVYDFERSGTKK